METQNGDTLAILCKLLKDRFGSKTNSPLRGWGRIRKLVAEGAERSARQIVVVDID